MKLLSSGMVSLTAFLLFTSMVTLEQLNFEMPHSHRMETIHGNPEGCCIFQILQLLWGAQLFTSLRCLSVACILFADRALSALQVWSLQQG